MEPQLATWRQRLDYAALSDVGLRRANNQDSYACTLAANEDAWRRQGHVFIVADGMGAHAAGELASKIAVETAPHTYYKLIEESPTTAARHAVEDSNAKIHTKGQANLDFRGMGTTCSMLVLLPDRACVAHVGDSRAYRLRGNRLDQLTFDHSLVWEMMAAKDLRDQEVPNYIPKNIITRSLGPNERVDVDVEGPFPLLAGDTFLLCSDGLSGQLDDELIGVVLGCLPPSEAVRALVDLANLNGGPDNITAVVAQVRVAEPGSSPHAESAEAHGAPAFENAPARPPSRVAPFYWVSAGVLTLSAAIMFFFDKSMPALACAVAAVAATVLAVLSGGSPPAPQAVASRASRFGRGPHRTRDCGPSRQVLDRLAGLTGQLRDAAIENAYPVQWQPFDAHVNRATAALETQDIAEATRQQCRAISCMMAELRRVGANVRRQQDEEEGE